MKSCLLLALLWMSSASLAADYDAEIKSFSAAQTIPAKWLKGAYHRVDPDVINQNFMNHYRIHSGLGRFSARGDAQLYVRIKEINALARLQEMSKSRVFVESAGDTVTSTVDNVSSAVENPSGLKQGFSRLMKRLGRIGKNAYEKTRSLMRKEDDRTAEMERAGSDLARSFLGVDSAYRELARDLGVDPYTRNNQLRREMDSMAKVSAAGSFGIKTIIPVLPLLYGAGYLISVSNLIYNTHPVDLLLQNEKELRGMGVSEKLIERLVRNKWHTLTTLTRITASLGSMQGVKGRSILVRHASDAADVGEALLYTEMTELLAIYHRLRTPIVSIVGTDRIPFAVTRSGSVVVIPVDYLNWTKTADAVTSYLRARMADYRGQQEMWVTGWVSHRAKTNLGSAGWELFDRAGQRL